MKDKRTEIFETILLVLKEWEDLQPNFKSRACRHLLARELTDALQEGFRDTIEDIVCGVEE
jgi:hypothetical protein